LQPCTKCAEYIYKLYSLFYTHFQYITHAQTFQTQTLYPWQVVLLHLHRLCIALSEYTPHPCKNSMLLLWSCIHDLNIVMPCVHTSAHALMSSFQSQSTKRRHNAPTPRLSYLHMHFPQTTQCLQLHVQQNYPVSYKATTTSWYSELEPEY